LAYNLLFVEDTQQENVTWNSAHSTSINKHSSHWWVDQQRSPYRYRSRYEWCWVSRFIWYWGSVYCVL